VGVSEFEPFRCINRLALYFTMCFAAVHSHRHRHTHLRQQRVALMRKIENEALAGASFKIEKSIPMYW
jgi:hypothetical protein